MNAICVCCSGSILRTLRLFHVILHSLLTGGEELIAVFSLSFSISPALSTPLWLKLMCGVTVNPPMPIHPSTHHIKTPRALSASKFLPSSLSAHSHVLQLLAWIQLTSSLYSTGPLHFPILLFSQSYNLPHPLPLPSSSTWGYMITHFGGNRFPQSSPNCEHSLHHNRTVAKLLSCWVCHANVALGTATLPLKYCVWWRYVACCGCWR